MLHGRDGMSEKATVGGAKGSRVCAIGPCVRPRGRPRRVRASATFVLLAEAFQRRAEAFCFSSLRIMIRARLLDGLGLGALSEVRVGEARREAVAFLLRGGRGFGETVPLGVHIDEIGKRNVEPGLPKFGLDSDSAPELQRLD